MKTIIAINKSLVVLAASSMLYACNTPSEGSTSELNSDQITIATSEQTKATPVVDPNYPSIKIWGIESDGTISDDIAGEELSQSTSDLGTGEKVWSFSTVKYWGSRTSLDFIAISPSMAIDFTGDDPTIEYSTAQSISAQNDLLLAQTTTLCSEQVSLGFEHLLTRFNFEASLATDSGFSSDETVKITSIELLNMPVSGDYNITDKEWSVDEETYDYTLTSGSEITDKALTTTMGSILSDNGYAMMIPLETIPNDTYINISYQVLTTGSEQSVEENIVIDLGSKLEATKAGYAYKVSLEISKFFVDVAVLSKIIDGDTTSDFGWSDEDIDTDLVYGSYILASPTYFYASLGELISVDESEYEYGYETIYEYAFTAFDREVINIYTDASTITTSATYICSEAGTIDEEITANETISAIETSVEDNKVYFSISSDTLSSISELTSYQFYISITADNIACLVPIYIDYTQPQ